MQITHCYYINTENTKTHKYALHTHIDPFSHESSTAPSFINISTPHTHTHTHLPSSQLLRSFLYVSQVNGLKEDVRGAEDTELLCTFLPSSWLLSNWHHWPKPFLIKLSWCARIWLFLPRLSLIYSFNSCFSSATCHLFLLLYYPLAFHFHSFYYHPHPLPLLYVRLSASLSFSLYSTSLSSSFW